jgi:hypothetical protein
MTCASLVGTEALAEGVVTRHQLRTRYDAVHRNVYVPKGHILTAADKAIAAWLWSRTRLVLTAAGLRPQRTQIDVFDRFADHVGRIDMGWDDWKVGVEYDGELRVPPACGRRNAGRATSIARPNWRRSVGESSASAPTCCAIGPAPSWNARELPYERTGG